ncbi:hypothetical protein ADT25_00830 [Xanthomonas oryzae]|uniref:Uncharacterized protein n=1 Tax=Xanthomonas oryzae TaxID=347 RepID=A0AAP1F086_9XANT|nr:hypothetical protein ADT25_00830 [Xanthomonas oryzae]QBG83837.1 hypothetical protein EYR27_07925 [Xanthomonas oryzae]
MSDRVAYAKAVISGADIVFARRTRSHSAAQSQRAIVRCPEILEPYLAASPQACVACGDATASVTE